MNKLHMLAGLPRSGTTLLGAILNQNPKVYVTTTSPFVEILWRNYSVWFEESEIPCLDTLKIRDLKKPFLKNVAHSYFNELTDKEIVIDKRRSWHKIGNMRMYSEIYGVKPKVICTVRDVAEIIVSFMKVFEEHGKVPKTGETLNSKAEENIFKDVYPWLEDSFYSSIRPMKQDCWFSECIHLVEYDDLIDNTTETLNGIYEFLELEPFEHDLKNIKVAEQEGDHGWKNLHEVRGDLTKTKVPLTKYLTEYEIKQYNDKNFWRKNG